MARRRKSGTGTLRKRADGRWEGRVVTGYDEKGLPRTKNVLAKTKSECREKLKKLQEEYTPLIRKCQPDMPFGDWVAFWYETYCRPNLGIRTQPEYANRIYNHIIPQIGQIPLNQLTQNDLQQFFASLKKSGRRSLVEQHGAGLSDAMVRKCHMTCNAALKRAVQEELIRFNPAAGCKLPPKKSAEMQILTQEEMQRFLIQAREDGLYELFLLELATGMRLGEIIALQWRDLNFATGELRISKSACYMGGELVVTEPKTRASVRTVILPGSVLRVLDAYKKTVDSRWMFPSPAKEDGPLTPNYVRRRMQQTLERAQCKKVRFHDLRHTFATMALEHGLDVKTLSTIIGHVSSATTLDIYSHVTDTMQKQAAVKIDRHIGKTDAPMPEEAEKKPHPDQRDFQPWQPTRRKRGTGCVCQINDHLWEGKYIPRNADGKRISRSVYGRSKEECEEKLAALIQTVKAEIEAEKAIQKQEAPSEMMMQ